MHIFEGVGEFRLRRHMHNHGRRRVVCEKESSVVSVERGAVPPAGDHEGFFVFYHVENLTHMHKVPQILLVCHAVPVHFHTRDVWRHAYVRQYLVLLEHGGGACVHGLCDRSLCV